jgi:hypothetical protein
MLKHIWRVIDCKNPDCGFMNLLKYYGVYQGQLEIAEMFATDFSWQCAKCGKIYRYESEETQMRLLDYSPPAGWKCAFGPEFDLPTPSDHTAPN